MKQLSKHKQTSEKIRDLYTVGKTKDEIQYELGVDRKTVNIALGYMLKKANQAIQPSVKSTMLPYAERDARMHQIYSALNKKGAMSMFNLDECKSNYGRKLA